MMYNAHALIIDDNVTNIEVMGELLSVMGMTYTALRDPAHLDEAIDQAGPIDVVFLDLEMPKLNGYEVFDILSGELGMTVPIVASTVHLNEINTAREMGFHSFVGKPLKVNRFPGQVERILNGERVWEAG